MALPGASKALKSAGRAGSKTASNLGSKVTQSAAKKFETELGDMLAEKGISYAEDFIEQKRIETGKKLREKWQGNSGLEQEEVQEVKQEEQTQKAQQQAAIEERKLAQAQREELEKARKGVSQSNALPGTLSVNTDQQNKALENQQKEQEYQQEVNQDTQDKVDAITAKYEKKIADVGKEPGFPLSLFLLGSTFTISMFVDSIVSVFGAGDVFSFMLLALFWLYPCFKLMRFGPFLLVYGYLLFDLFLGGVASVILTPVVGVGWIIDMAIDAFPELVLFMIGMTPPHVFTRAYDDSRKNKIAHYQHLMKQKIALAKKEGKSRLSRFRSGIRGHFTGFASDRRKMVLFFILGITIYFTYFLGMFGYETRAQIINTSVFFAALIILKLFGILDTQQIIGTLGVLVINMIFPILTTQLDPVLSPIFGSNSSAIAIGFIITAMALIILHLFIPVGLPWITIIAILALILFALYMPYYLTYITSDDFVSDIERQRVETEADLDTFNFWERAINWYYEMQARGRGEYIPPAEQERVHEFIGITMSSIEASRSEFIEGQPVQFNIQYETGSSREIKVLTTCDSQGFQGNITPVLPVPATELYTPIVRCVFDGLPKGSQLVTIKGFYEYNSTIEIPLYFMTELQQRAILDRGGDPESFIGDIASPRTTSGPVDFGVSNRIGENNPGLELPLVYDAQNPNEFPQTIFLTLRNPTGSKQTQGELQSISQIEFDLPQGLHIGNCDFMLPQTGRLDVTSTENGRWIFDVTDRFETFKLNDVISCNLLIDEEYTSTYLPQTGFSLHTMYFTIHYTYGLTQSAPVTIT